jgi:DNA-binding response OmpR family regulator
VTTDPLLVYPDPPAAVVARALDQAGLVWKGLPEPTGSRGSGGIEDGAAGALVSLVEGAEAGLAACRALRKREAPVAPLLVVCSVEQVGLLSLREDLFDDFCCTPLRPGELEARLGHLWWRAGRGAQPELVEHGALQLNLETYQAAVAGHPLDLTYMEYELLKFLASHPGKVFTREVLLSRVWGYEYYGGARTVDVHIRRLRAKLGEPHANLIQTVRSVGYRFGQAKGW